MKLISYNVNSIRSAIEKGFFNWLTATDADIVCLQETKCDISQISTMEFELFGYKNFWHSAVKKGYSGVAILTKKNPIHVVYGINNPLFDNEGRAIRIDFQKFSVLNVYMPSGASSFDRLEYKHQWQSYFYQYVADLKKSISNLIVVGDFNICHSTLDLFNPELGMYNSGFLKEERDWLDDFFNLGFIDSFRHFNQNPYHYTWWSYMANAKNSNLGWRIDYICTPTTWINYLVRCQHLVSVSMSDHCPVLVEYKENE